MDGVLGNVNVESKKDKEEYYSVKDYNVLESSLLFKGEQLVKLLILEDTKGRRQLFQFDNTSSLWGIINTLVVGDKIQICWLISVKNVSNIITDARLID